MVSALFDINPSMSTHMAVPLWKRCVGTLLEVLQLLQDEPWIQVDEFYEPPAEDRLEDPPAGQPAKVGQSGRRLGHFVFHWPAKTGQSDRRLERFAFHEPAKVNH